MQKSIALTYTNNKRLEDTMEVLKKGFTIATRNIKHLGIKLIGNVQEPIIDQLDKLIVKFID